jgi:glutamine amidotransferase
MAASTEYGIEFASAVADGNVYGCQFHPEKSGKVGLDILRGFCDL